jgi:hypothetical protein
VTLLVAQDIVLITLSVILLRSAISSTQVIGEFLPICTALAPTWTDGLWHSRITGYTVALAGIVAFSLKMQGRSNVGDVPAWMASATAEWRTNKKQVRDLHRPAVVVETQSTQTTTVDDYPVVQSRIMVVTAIFITLGATLAGFCLMLTRQSPYPSQVRPSFVP